MAGKRRRPEEALQRQVAAFLDVALPGEATWFHPPNGGGRSRVEAAIFKATGVKAGVPDIVIIHAGRGHFIELKAPSGGSLSPAQREMHARLADAGAHVAVCRSLEEVSEALADFGVPLKAREAA